jgi:hypothetical protein
MAKMTKTKPAFANLAAFQAEHNPDVKIPAKIKAGLASLLAEGKESAEYEVDFASRCGLGVAFLSKYRDQFSKHIVSVRLDGRSTPKNVWFADVKVAAKARGV